MSRMNLFSVLCALLLTAFVGSTAMAQSGSAPATQPAAKDTYPLTTCVVGGEKLGSMGKPYVLTHEGREVRLCCKACEPKFKADPAKYIKKLDDAAAKQKETAPAKQSAGALTATTAGAMACGSGKACCGDKCKECCKDDCKTCCKDGCKACYGDSCKACCKDDCKACCGDSCKTCCTGAAATTGCCV